MTITKEQAIQAILNISGDPGRYCYKLIRHVDTTGDEEVTTVLVRDDGYRFHYMVLESPAGNAQLGEWELFAEYKQSNNPRLVGIIANHFMTAVAIEALQS